MFVSHYRSTSPSDTQQLHVAPLVVRALGRLCYRPWVLAALAILCFTSVVHAEVELPVGDDTQGIVVEARSAQRWKQGAYEVWQLNGGVTLRQGDVVGQARDAVLWIDRPERTSSEEPSRIIAYLEGDVRVDYGRSVSARVNDKTWFGRFHTVRDITLNVPMVRDEPALQSALFQRGSAARKPVNDPGVKPAQFTTSPVPTPIPAVVGPEAVAAPAAQPLAGVRRVQVFPRSIARVQLKWFPIPERNERVAVIDSGVQVQVDGPDTVGKLDLEADRIVIWTSEGAMPDLSGKVLQDKNIPLEFYLEGNIIFRQGDRIIYADRMYYNISQEYGVVLNAEMLTPVPEYQGLLRLKADVLQQVDKHNFQAYGASVTSSRLGVPRYWLQSQQLTFQDNQRVAIDPFTGAPAVDPNTGEELIDHDMMATSSNNFVYFGGVPIFYWPRLATDLEQPTYYIQRIKVGNDQVFGFQVYTDLDAYQLLGMRNRPEGTKWNISADLLSKRGAAFGTNFRYNRGEICSVQGPAYGFIDLWGLYDSGIDNLGADRRDFIPESRQRGRLRGQHRQQLEQLGEGWQVTAEAGFISDYNFLEEYFNEEWNTQKDPIMGVELKRYDDNMTYSVNADVRVNDFFTQTNWLPRADHFWLGQDIFETLTYSAHSSAGYAQFQTAVAPTFPADFAKFQLLQWEVPAEGARVASRQEIDFPFALGAMKFVPYALGEAAYWGEDITGNDNTRLFGQAGVRASLPIWTVDRNVQSELLNINGLAHKMTFNAEAFYADANQDMTEYPLYDLIDDVAVDHFRRRFFFNTFGGVKGGHIPLPFDERYYALRSGIQGSVTSPSTEIADDLMIARIGLNQRWQTKRGLPGQERIIDLVTLNVQASFFPDAQRDNFGQDWGLVNYDFSWHIGDRLAILSDGYADFFPEGMQTASIGALMTRPESGSVYVGYRAIDGPLESSLVSAFVNYRMSEKWIATAGSSVDLKTAGNIGQNLSFTRIGESLLIRMGFNYDVSRDNFGIQFEIQPRMLTGNALGVVGGVPIAPAGAYGLE